jgi:FkbM family methyltransferase
MTNILQRLAREKYPVRFALSRILWALKLSSFITMQRQGYRLRFYPSSTSAMMWVDPLNSPQDENLFHRMLRPGDLVIDVGANIGALTLCASTLVGAAGKVISIEAHPRTYAYLQGNLALNRVANVESFNLAMGEKEGSIHFTDQRADEQNVVTTEDRGIPVPMKRLDALPIAPGPIELLKIDVEGYEKFVLEGAAGLLDRTRCVYFESWEHHFQRFGYGCCDLFHRLTEHGFQLLKIVEEKELVLLSENHISHRCEDLLAVRDLEHTLQRLGLPLTTRLEAQEN